MAKPPLLVGPVTEARKAQAALAEAIELIRELTDSEDGACLFDHHGYCQEHGWFDTDPPCIIPRARAFVVKHGDQ